MVKIEKSRDTEIKEYINELKEILEEEYRVTWNGYSRSITIEKMEEVKGWIWLSNQLKVVCSIKGGYGSKKWIISSNKDLKELKYIAEEWETITKEKVTIKY